MSALLALAILVAQETPQEIFNRIEAAIEGAKTLKVEFTIDASAEEALPGKGFISIGEGGRVKLSAELKSKDRKTLTVTMDCDGTKIQSVIDQNRVEAAFDPKMGRSNFNMYLSRLGVLAGVMLQHGFWVGSARSREPVTMDLKQVLQVEKIQFAGDGKGGSKSLTYEFKSAFQPMPLERARLWYDPKTYRIVRREYQLKGKSSVDTVYEDYTDVQFGDEKAGKEKAPPPPPIPDAEMENLFFKAKLQVAESHLKAGKKDKAAEILEEIIKTYPRHPQIAEARRLLEEAKKK